MKRLHGLRVGLAAAILICAAALVWMLYPTRSVDVQPRSSGEAAELSPRANSARGDIAREPSAALSVVTVVPETARSTVDSAAATQPASHEATVRGDHLPGAAKSSEQALFHPNGAQPVAVLTPLQDIESRLKAAEHDPDKTRILLGRAIVDERLPAEWRSQQWQRLQGLNAQRVFSAVSVAGFRTLTVRKGESLWALTQRNRKTSGVSIAHGLLAAINEIPAGGLHAGAKVKVPEHPLEVLIDKSEFRLYLLLDGAVIHHVSAGIGRENRTPEGEFTIGSRLVHPEWTDPKTGKVIPYGTPGHLIGSRWLGFVAAGKKTGFGIHGTVEPQSVGKALSDGCIRLGEQDLTRVFEWIPEGTTVRVRP
jgi:lipoprotein-anchoring transpeptidase ErfK/SrfK